MMWCLTMAAVLGLAVSGAVSGQAPTGAPPPAGPALPSATPPSTQPSGPAGEAQGNYARLKGFIVKAATDMPPESYAFKPTPDVRTFARVATHVVEVQVRVCGTVNHTPPAEMLKTPAETADKAVILNALKSSFVECDKAYGLLTDANLADMFQAGPARRSRIGLLWGNVSHDNEQYATLALYMRLKGLVPPSSEK